MITSIQVNGQAVNVVTPPFTSTAFRSVEWSFKDAVALNQSPFDGQTQTYTWPGADSWCPMDKPGVMTLPNLTQPQAAAWKAALMECRGISLPFLLSDPLQPQPMGNLEGSQPEIDNATAGSNQTGMTTLATKGWLPSRYGVLQPGDYVQVGYRMHVNLDWVMVDATGRATLNLWPSLREVPVDSSALRFSNPQGGPGLAGPCGAVGLFRRASNTATWSATIGGLTSLSFQIAEYR